jgi:hypothetical protein
MPQRPAARIGAQDVQTPPQPGLRQLLPRSLSPMPACSPDGTGIRPILWVSCGPHVW